MLRRLIILRIKVFIQGSDQTEQKADADTEDFQPSEGLVE